MVRRNNMKKYGFNASRIATILLAFLLVAGLGIPVSHPGLMSAYADPAVSSWAELANAIRSGGTKTITLGADFAYDGTSIEIPRDAKITITGGTDNRMIYSTTEPVEGKYKPMFVVGERATLTIDNNVTLSGKVDDNGSQCPDGTSETPTYTADKFTGAYAAGAKTYTPKGFFIDVAAGGSATLNGTLSDFITSRDKSSTPRYVAPVVANGTGATFNLGADGVIKNNLVGYIVDDDMAYTDAQTIKQYVKGAPPNSLRVPGSAEQKSHPDKYERTRNRNAGIDGNADEDLGSGITGTAGAVIYKDGAQGEILGTIDNNRGDTGGVMASGDGTVVHIKGGTKITRNVGVQFGGGSTTEQGAMIAMHSGTMKQNVAWFGGGAVYATENGVDWLLGKIVKADGKPDFDARKDGKFTMKNGSLEENTAFTRGGAILVDSDGVTVKSGKLKNNMSWMLGGAVYVMGDHPKYTYTMRIDPVYVHDNTAVSGLKDARDQAALNGEKTSAVLEADNAKLQRKLAAPSDCADISETDDLFTAGKIERNTDDRTDGKGNDGTGGGVWLCPYGSVFFDAEKTGNVVIYKNYATGTTSNSANNADATYNSKSSKKSHSRISGGSDLHTDQGKQDGGVTISGLKSGGWINENNDQTYKTETSSNRTNLVSTREPVQAGDVPNKYQDGKYVEVTGNIARRGGGLASDGKFYFGPAPSLAGINAKMTVGKEWTAAAKTEPIAIRVSVKKGNVEHVVADVPLDGVANGPVSEFDTVSELKPVGNLWTGEFSLPLVVTDDEGQDPIQLYELYYEGELIDITELSGREALGELVKTNKQGDIEIRQATGVEIIYKEMNVKRDDGGNWVVDGEHGTHVFTPDSVDFSKLKFTVEEKEEVTEKYIYDDGNLVEEPVYGIYTLGLALKMESGNDNEPIVEKYVNKKVHADIVNFDQDFTYDVMAYVPYKATEITIEDTLVKGLEFADKNGNKVTDRSTVESITVKPMNDHKPNGTVSEDAMKNPSNPKYAYELKDSNHTDISIVDNKISVTIRNIQQEKDSSSYGSHPSELKGRWVRLTFHARIKDEYRSIEALKALQDSWLDKDDSKTGSYPHDVSFENLDKVLIKPVLEAKKDAVVWAVEGPQRLFARTVSGAYFATEDKENGTGWVKLDQGSDLWNNADRRYRGQAKDTKRELDIENADSALVAALEDMDEVKRYRAVRGAEGGTKLFVEIESISNGDKEVYQTPDSDKKQGHTWDKLEPGTSYYNNAINVMNGANNTVRNFDFESEAVSLKGDGFNWPVITEEKHEGMSNQAGYQVKFGNNASAKLRSNIVTVAPETTELDVIKKWAPNGKWPDDVKNVKFNVFSKKGNVVKQVYVDDDGNFVGAFEEGDQIPAGAKELTVTLSADNPTTDKDESKTTVKGLPKLIGTTYIARETKITYIEGGEDKTAAVDYLDDTYKVGTAKLGEGAAAETVFVSVDSSYKGNGAKLKKLKLTNAMPVRGAIAQNRLWALASNGDYYFTAENDTDGTADSSQWMKIEKPAGNADPSSDGVKNYAFAQKILGKIDANGRFSTVEDEELDNDKIEELDQPTVFDVTNEITATNEKAFEKYVNNDVHADLKEFDKAFKYDIMVYVPVGSTKLTITDPLASALEFAKKKDSLDAAEKTAAEKAADAGETIESVVYKAKNDHKAGSTVAGKDENNPATAIAATDYKASIADNKLLIEFEGAEDPDNVGKKLPVAFAGNWVQVTFWAKYTDAVIKAVNAGDFTKVRENGAVISEDYPNVAADAADGEFSHEGTVNKASAKITVNNDSDSEVDLDSNEVTVEPETEQLWVQKKWQDENGEEPARWPKGLKVNINVYKNKEGSEPEVVKTLTVDSSEKVCSDVMPKLVGVTYTVDEVEVPDRYTKLDEIGGEGTEEKPYVITNRAIKYTSVDITKKWAGLPVDDIPSVDDFKSYLVLRDGKGEDVTAKYADNLKITAQGNVYKARWVDLPDDEYTVKEKAVPGFETAISEDGKIITNSKKPSEEKPEIEKYVNQAVHKDIKLDEVFTYDIIAYVTKDADSVKITDKLHDMLTFEGDSSDVSVVDLGEADNHLVTNNVSGVKVNDKATVAKEGKIIDGTAVSFNDQVLTVFITNTLKKSDAVYDPVQIDNIDPSAEGYYEKDGEDYKLTTDTSAQADKQYYEERYKAAENIKTGDDVSGGYYEKDGDVYKLTEDVTAENGKTYYERVFNEVTIEFINPSQKGYYEKDGETYKATTDVVADPGKQYYVKSETGYEYDEDEDQPVTALRGHWIKVTFKARINDKTLEEVKKAYQDISDLDVDDGRDPENVGNAPVISEENHTGIPNDASYTIGVANEAGIKEDVHVDRSNVVTVKPEEKKKEEPKEKPEDEGEVKPDDEDNNDVKDVEEKGSKKIKSANTGDETPLGYAIFGLLGSAAVLELMRRRRMS